MSITNSKEVAVSRGLTQIMRTMIRNTRTLWPSIAMRVPSTSEQENYAWLNDVEGMKEFLGERIFKELRATTYQIRNKTWEQSVGLDRHKVADDNYGMYTPVAQKTAQKGARHPDALLVDLIVNAETNVCYDGQFFFDTDHVEGDSGTQSNLLDFEVVDNTNVTAAEFKKAFHNALLQMFTFKTDTGDLIVDPLAAGFEDDSLKILVPLPLYEVADAAMTNLLGEGGGTFHRLRMAEVLPVTPMGSVMGGSDTLFDLIYTGDVIKPYIFQDRSPLVYQTKGSNDIESKLIKLMGESRYNMGYGLWQHAVRTKFVNA
jgi:phage major head subunit gpT-like protein